MTEKEFFEIVKVGKFFKGYCPGVSNFYHKSRKMDGAQRNPLDFSPEDKAKMKAAANKLADEIKKVKF